MPGTGRRASVHRAEEPRPEAERRGAMTWAQRLRRVFHIDIETCSACGGPVRVIASIEDPVLIEKILAHVGEPRPGGAAGRECESTAAGCR